MRWEIAVIDARSIPPAVQWHEGMLLSPQHFQQATRRQESLQSYMTLAAAPYGWGVSRLNIDKAALVGRVFAVTELEAILPDGLVVTHYAHLDPAAPRLEFDLAPLLADPRPKRIAVHLAVAASPSGAGQHGGHQRYRQFEDPNVLDENTADNGIAMARYVPLLGLQITESPQHLPSQRFVSLPLAVLECGPQGPVQIDYEPPRFRLDQQSLVFQCANRVCADLRSKATEWGVRLSGALAEGQAAVASESVTTLRMIARGLPRLDALLATAATHPFDLYLALCDIAGDLSVIGGQVMLPAFGGYRHVELLGAFQAVAGYIDAALRQLRTPYSSVAFEHPEPGRFILVMRPEYQRAASLVIGARLGAGQDAAAVREWFDSAVIGGVSRIAAMRDNAVIGAAREAIGSVPELDLLPPPNMVLFRVSTEAGFVAAGDVLEISQTAMRELAEPVELRLFYAASQS